MRISKIKSGFLVSRLLVGFALLFCGARASAEDSPVVMVAPFRYIHNEIVAQVRVNGHGPYAMLLDTGTSPSVVDLTLARQIGLKIDTSGQEGSGGGTAANLAYQTSLPQVRLGGLTAKNIPALALDLSGLSRKFGQPIQGILGDSLFSGRVVQFDYPRRIARFYLRSPSATSLRGEFSGPLIAFPFRHTDEVHFSGVRVNGQPVAANLDTGSSSEFQLTPKAIRRLGLTQAAARAKPTPGAGFNGAFTSRTGTLAVIQVGPIRVAAPSVVFWQPGTGRDDEPWDVNVGNRFWQNYIVTIDYQQDIITLQRP